MQPGKVDEILARIDNTVGPPESESSEDRRRRLERRLRHKEIQHEEQKSQEAYTDPLAPLTPKF